jgi:hypothetical protein
VTTSPVISVMVWTDGFSVAARGVAARPGAVLIAVELVVAAAGEDSGPVMATSIVATLRTR